VEIEYSSLDDDESPVEGNYSADSFADVTFKDIEITHFITSSNNPDTLVSEFNPTNPDITIGEELTYNIEVEIPKFIYTGVSITQELPAGFTFLSGSTLTDDVAAHGIESIVINPDNTITFTFGDIDNTGPSAGDGFLLQTQVLVTDVVSN